MFKDKSAACIEDMESIIISMYLECTSEIPNMQLENMQNINMLQGDSKLAILFYIIIFFSLFKFEFPLLKEIPDASLQNFVACVCVCAPHMAVLITVAMLVVCVVLWRQDKWKRLN